MHLKLLSRFRWKNISVPHSNLRLRQPADSDYEQWSALRRDSQAFLQPWEPSWPKDDLSKIGYQRRMKAYNQQRQTGWGRTYFLFDDITDELLGGISLTRISYRVAQSATLGYWMGAHHAGKGNMRKTVPAILTHAFRDLGLNRVEAACLPRNARSIHLLTASGFQKEGFAREYLEINGVAEDHILFGKLKTEHIAS